MRKNGTIVSGSLLKVKNGEVRLSGNFTPLTFRPGDIVAIQFEELLNVPDVFGTVRLKFLYDKASKQFQQHRVLIAIGRWTVSQRSKVETVTLTEYDRDDTGRIVSSRSVDRQVERFDPEATATAEITNKAEETILATVQLRVSGAPDKSWIIEQDFTLKPGQQREATIRFATQGLKIGNVAVEDLFNRPEKE